MNQVKINELKAVFEVANSAYNEEKCRLETAGFKSNERYELLKPLKTAADKAHTEYSKFAKGQIARELDKIIAAQTPAQRAEGLRRARGL